MRKQKLEDYDEDYEKSNMHTIELRTKRLTGQLEKSEASAKPSLQIDDVSLDELTPAQIEYVKKMYDIDVEELPEEEIEKPLVDDFGEDLSNLDDVEELEKVQEEEKIEPDTDYGPLNNKKRIHKIDLPENNQELKVKEEPENNQKSKSGSAETAKKRMKNVTKNDEFKYKQDYEKLLDDEEVADRKNVKKSRQKSVENKPKKQQEKTQKSQKSKPRKDVKEIVADELTMGQWIGIMILMCIPIVGLVYLIVTALKDKNYTKRMFARASLVLTLIGVIVVFALSVVLGVGLSNSLTGLANSIETNTGVENVDDSAYDPSSDVDSLFDESGSFGGDDSTVVIDGGDNSGF
jgi:hypothetical protein